jgi:cytochrome c biogenesis protein CcdA
MTETLLPVASAFWLGVLTSISPCALATNIAAISFLGRTVESPRRAFFGGSLYVIGRAAAYILLGSLLVTGLLSAPGISAFLQSEMNRLLGPLLIVVGMFLLGMISFVHLGGIRTEGLRRRIEAGGTLAALPLGIVFALSFCPTSAALFFVGLVPMAVREDSAVILPALFGLGTGIPVLFFAVMLALGAHHVARAFDRVVVFEKWGRGITGALFIGVGIYYCLVYVFRVL